MYIYIYTHIIYIYTCPKSNNTYSQNPHSWKDHPFRSITFKDPGWGVLSLPGGKKIFSIKWFDISIPWKNQSAPLKQKKNSDFKRKVYLILPGTSYFAGETVRVRFVFFRTGVLHLPGQHPVVDEWWLLGSVTTLRWFVGDTGRCGTSVLGENQRRFVWISVTNPQNGRCFDGWNGDFFGENWVKVDVLRTCDLVFDAWEWGQRCTGLPR